MSMSIRRPAVAGLFYPEDSETLRTMVRHFLDRASLSDSETVETESHREPCALVAPHAGYIYSGSTAAHAYRTLRRSDTEKGRRVFLVGPSHHAYLEVLSVGGYAAFETPLGRVDVDTETVDRLVMLPGVTRDRASHQREHALEVQIPFLQETLGDFRLVPMVVGRIACTRLADILLRDWSPDDLIVVSSDLSHYHPDEEAKRLDNSCHQAVLSLDTVGLLRQCEACGIVGMGALIEIAIRMNWSPKLVRYQTSGDTAGDRDSVVGYASYLFYATHATSTSGQEAQR